MRVICFDLWNTLCRSLNSNGAGYQDILVEAGVDPAQVYPFVRDHLMTRLATYDQLAAALLQRFGLDGRDGLRGRIVAAWRQDNDQSDWFPGARELVADLRQRGSRVVLVTNITQPAWKATSKRLGLEWSFDSHYLSFEMGHSKPDNHVWATLEAKHQAAEMWMVGDNQQDDLYGPSSRGWRAMLVAPDGSSIDHVRNFFIGLPPC